MAKHTASCLCGAVRWETDADLGLMTHCHCGRCRKAHGSTYATHAASPADRFSMSGAEHVVRYHSSDSGYRCFCGQCGSAVPGDPDDGNVFMPCGNFDDDPGVRPLAHIFAGDKAPWFEIDDDLPAFEAWPPGYEHLAVVAAAEPADPPGKPRGSCLCGAVAFVLEETPTRGYFCHCSRCRKARSSAFATNLFLPADAVRFTRGADRIRSYKLPEAERFGQHFCKTCGAKMPRPGGAGEVTTIPAGCLDDDPGMRPAAHIFVGSKANWDEIGGDLPQHDEYPPR